MKEREGSNHKEQQGIFPTCPHCLKERLALHKIEGEAVCGTHARNAEPEIPASDEDIERVREYKRETNKADLNTLHLLRPGIEAVERAYMMAGFNTGIDEFIDILNEGGDIERKAIDSHIDWDTLSPMSNIADNVHRTLLILSYHKGLDTGLTIYEDKPAR